MGALELHLTGTDHQCQRLTVTANAEHRAAGLHLLIAAAHHKRPNIRGRLEQRLPRAQDDRAFLGGKRHRHRTGTVEDDLAAIGQRHSLLLTDAGVVVGIEHRPLLPSRQAGHREHH
ncbi:hypothetical protein D3C84_1000420 [compost metagenome]